MSDPSLRLRPLVSLLLMAVIILRVNFPRLR